MRTTTVPAQITTVEDKIAGSLTLQQLIILSAPIFLDFIVYIMVPSFLKLSFYKFILIILITLSFCVSAVRFKGKLIIFWLITIINFNNRPRYFIYNKNDRYMRDESPTVSTKLTPTYKEQAKHKQYSKNTSLKEMFLLNSLLDDPSVSLSFVSNKKAGLSVHITQVKQ
jgi:hypothetical protein